MSGNKAKKALLSGETPKEGSETEPAAADLIQHLYYCLRTLAGDKADTETEEAVRTLTEGIETLARQNREFQERLLLKAVIDEMPVGVAIADASSGKVIHSNAHASLPVRTVSVRDRDGVVRYRVILSSDTAELRDRETLIRRIMDVEPWPISYIDADCRYRRVNRAYEEWFGRAVGEIEGRQVRDVLGEEAWQAIRPYLERALSGEEVTFEEEVPYRVSGPRLVHVTYTPDRDESGQVRGLIAHVVDVGEWRQVHEALRKSEERYRRLFEDDLTGDVVTAHNGRILACNQAFARIFGFSSVDEAQNADIRETYVSPEERDELLRRLTGEGKIESKTGTRRRKDGTLIYAVENVVGRRDADGEVFEVVEYIHDDTERRRGEEALRGSEERFRAVLENSLDAAYRRDLKTDRYDYMSPVIEKITGFSADEMRAMSVQEVTARIHPEDRASVEAALADAAASGSGNLEYRFRVKDGRYRWLSDHLIVTRDAQGRPLFRSGLVHDITERKQAQEALQKSSAILKGVNRILQETLTIDTEEELGSVCLTVAEEITNSRFGFIAELNKEDRLDTLTISNPGWSACRMPVPTGMAVHGIYGRVLMNGRSLCTNDPSSHPDSIGVPEGHPPLTAFLGVPLIYNGTVIGMVGLGNKEGGYAGDDLVAVEAVAPVIAEALMRKRVEKEQRRLLLENRRLAASLEQERDLLLTIMDNTDVHIAYLDDKFRFVRVNPAYVSDSGYTAEELIGKNQFDLFPDVETRGVFERVRETGEPFRCYAMPFAYPELFRDGVTYWDWSLVPVKGAAGRILGFVLSLTDVTDRIRALEALQKSEERFRTIFEGIPVGVAIQSPDGTVTAMNPAAGRLLGVAGEEIGNIDAIHAHLRTVHEDGSPYPAEEHPSMVTARTGRPVRDAVMGIYRPEERDYRWILINTVPQFREGEERPYEVFITFDDITERKQSEEVLLRHTRELARIHRDLEAAHREANLYLDILTHDIGNTENVANLYADLLLGMLSGDAATYMEKLKRSIDKSIEILGTVSTIRRIHAGSPEIRQLDLDTVINDEISHYPGSSIRYESAPGPILADDLLPEVFANLIGNAVKHGGPDVEITIRTKDADGFVRVSVEDTGPGVPDDQKEAIFHRYEQKRRGVGEGLGLYLVQILIDRYGGKVWVEDRVPGHPEQGAAFLFTLKKASAVRE
ncbi:MAG: hypothetical protein CVV31_02095 [Methanomicrobiales archaeon HGW-Methanomicrobiales-2]|jgi:PAS domain S-box-containing protein|nr:MAG: hypothetical protein CVV31_02095 [Methanomicrobiales archaeon HGW-Methanomicrobiales-2]